MRSSLIWELAANSGSSCMSEALNLHLAMLLLIINKWIENLQEDMKLKGFRDKDMKDGKYW